MDDQVHRAMQKWPDVPAVHGWLRLSRRGQWFLIDRGRPGFDEERDGAGSTITSPPILDFLGRNYDRDARGAWFWQNGPQRVYVDLDLTPLILRVLNQAPDQRLVTQTGYLVERIDAAFSDGDGNLLLQTDLGPAAIDDRDIGQLTLAEDDDGVMHLTFERYPGTGSNGSGDWTVTALPLSGPQALGHHFHYEPRPRAG